MPRYAACADGLRMHATMANLPWSPSAGCGRRGACGSGKSLPVRVEVRVASGIRCGKLGTLSS